MEEEDSTLVARLANDRAPIQLACVLGTRAWLHFELLFIEFLEGTGRKPSPGVSQSVCVGPPLSLLLSPWGPPPPEIMGEQGISATS